MPSIKTTKPKSSSSNCRGSVSRARSTGREKRHFKQPDNASVIGSNESSENQALAA